MSSILSPRSSIFSPYQPFFPFSFSLPSQRKNQSRRRSHFFKAWRSHFLGIFIMISSFILFCVIDHPLLDPLAHRTCASPMKASNLIFGWFMRIGCEIRSDLLNKIPSFKVIKNDPLLSNYKEFKITPYNSYHSFIKNHPLLLLWRNFDSLILSHFMVASY